MKTDFDVPREIAICPHCGSNLRLEVVEWEVDTGTPTEGGCYVSCVKDDPMSNDKLHDRSPYIYMLPVAMKVYQWAKGHVAVSPDEDELRAKLADWNAGKPLSGGMYQC